MSEPHRVSEPSNALDAYRMLQAAQASPALILRAVEVAVAAHDGQRRRYLPEPFVLHPLRVAAHAHGSGLPAEAVAAAALHDVLEDVADGADRLLEFSDAVQSIVWTLTNPWGDHARRDVAPAVREAHMALIALEPAVATIKTLDRADNLNDLARALDIASLQPRDARYRAIVRWAQSYADRSETREDGVALILPVAEARAARRFALSLERLRATIARS